MPRIAVPVNQIGTRAGLTDPTPTTGNATDNHSVSNDGQTFLRVENTGATPRLFTMKIEKTVDGAAAASKTKTIAAGATEWFGPFPTDSYGRTLLVDVAHAELVITAFRVVPVP